MPKKRFEFRLYGRIPKALLLWVICNTVLSAAASYLLCLICTNERIIGYTVSAVSFLSAAVTAKRTLSDCRKGVVLYALITATVLVVFSLLAGFLIDSDAIDLQCILSLSLFTFSGCMIGSMLDSGERKSRLRIKTAT